MKKLIPILALCLFTVLSNNALAQTAQQIQPGTVCVKHPMADDANNFFSTQSMIGFEVYKVSKEQVNAIIASFKKDPAVESFSAGTLTGDYQAFNLVLKANKNKEWFKTAFKNAGLNYIRINRMEIVPVEKM